MLVDPAGALDRVRALQVAAALASLRWWPPCGERLAGLASALAGADGCSAREWRALDRWADRWAALPARLREFYAAWAPRHGTASVALWRVLDGGPPLDGRQYGVLAALWREQFGRAPAIDLCPRARP